MSQSPPCSTVWSWVPAAAPGSGREGRRVVAPVLVLAGAAELVRRYERATATHKAVIHAAVDACRAASSRR